MFLKNPRVEGTVNSIEQKTRVFCQIDVQKFRLCYIVMFFTLVGVVNSVQQSLMLCCCVGRKRAASVSAECDEVETVRRSPGKDQLETEQQAGAGAAEQLAGAGAAERMARLSARLDEREEDYRLATERLQVRRCS